jgi:riboflavin synthase alpha subunit
MFTGIVQTVGRVAFIAKRGSEGSTGGLDPRSSLETPPSLQVDAQSLPYVPRAGGSVAIDGCCLTHLGDSLLQFHLSDETYQRTTLGTLEEGSEVNVEVALRAGDPIGGHFVTGHVDGIGRFLGSAGEEYRFEAPPGGEQFLADMGSVAISGVSLTVIRPTALEFSVALVPHTLQNTTLGRLRAGDSVNIEYDVLARYARRGV